MRIAILGAPGSGKEIQAKSLAAQYRVPQISPDGLLRAALADGEKLDEQTAQAVQAGRPVADETVLALLEERLRARDSKHGFIIVGFPGNIPQAQALDALLGMLGRALQISLYISLDDETLVKRITGRLKCSECDAVYNRHYSPPKTRRKCDNCGGKLVSIGGRTKNAAGKVKAHHEEIAPLMAYYKAQHKLRTVLATQDAEQTQQKICGIIDLEIRPLEIKTVETAAETLDEEINTVIAGGQIKRITPAPESRNSKRNKAKTAEVKATPIDKTGATGGKQAAKASKTQSTTPGSAKHRKSAKKPAETKSATKTPTEKSAEKTTKKAAKKPPEKTAPKTVS